MELKGKTVLVTGASHGIGEQTARLLSNCCACLILTARSVDKLSAMKDELQSVGCRVEIFGADMYDLKQTEALVEFISQFEVDIFINNAGKSICRPISQSTNRMHDFTRTMTLNYYSVVRIVLSLVDKGRRVHIVNVSTLNVLLPPTPYWASYSASKSAIDIFLRSVEAELKPLISLATIYFALVNTSMITPTAAYKNRRSMSVEQAARIVFDGRNWRPWWGRVASVASKMVRPIYQKMAMRLIDNG